MNPKIFGAFIIGGALVAGSYVVSNFGKTDIPQGDLAIVVSRAPERSAIAVYDKNNNGVPDWQETLLGTDPLEIEKIATSTYTPPDTLTGQFAVEFFEDTLKSKAFSVFGSSEEEILESSMNSLAEEAKDTIYFEKDISIIKDTQLNESLKRAYFNEAANIITRNSVTSRNEAAILEDALNSNNPEILLELAPIKQTYQNMRDEMLALSVPEEYVKVHLDLINVYHAIFRDIEGMELAFSDPLYTMLRMKRYEDDASGLFLALQNYYFAVLESPVLFDDSDPAFLFVIFEPKQ